MRSMFVVFGLFLPICVFALSCPSNGRILKMNGSIAEVTQQCGQPVLSHTYVNVTIVLAEWLYYRPDPADNTSTKLKLLFDHGQLANINSTNSAGMVQNVRFSVLCQSPIKVGDPLTYVQSVCGYPVAKKPLQTTSVEMTEFKYDGSSPNTLIFENGNLTAWK